MALKFQCQYFKERNIEVKIGSCFSIKVVTCLMAIYAEEEGGYDPQAQ